VLSTTSGGHNVDEQADASSPEDGGERSVGAAGRLAVTAEILRQLRLIASRMESVGRKTDVAVEWRQAAVVIDRCLFCLFLTTTVASSIIVLVLVPLCSRAR